MTPVLAWCAASIYLAYYATLRVRCVLQDGSLVRGDELPPLREIYAVCERDALAASGLLAGQRMAVLVAHGRDGNWASALLAALGCRVIRGSTRRGGVPALRTLLRHLAASESAVGLVVDGPLGPPGVAKPGAALCAMKSGCRMHAVGVACRWKLTFPRTWSGIYLPLPFSRIVFVDEVCREAHRESRDVAAASARLTQSLTIAGERAAGLLRDRAATERALVS